MKIDLIKRQVAASYDREAFQPLTGTYDFPGSLHEQERRQRRALDLAHAHIQEIVSAVIECARFGEDEPVN